MSEGNMEGPKVGTYSEPSGKESPSDGWNGNFYESPTNAAHRMYNAGFSKGASSRDAEHQKEVNGWVVDRDNWIKRYEELKAAIAEKDALIKRYEEALTKIQENNAEDLTVSGWSDAALTMRSIAEEALKAKVSNEEGPSLIGGKG